MKALLLPMLFLIISCDIFKVPDCTGLSGGDAVRDECGVCGGDGSTCVPVLDIDGNVYQTIQIGEQWWMAENLKTTHYNNGDSIPTGYSNSEWGELETGAYAVYDDDLSNAGIYGNLYNWYTVDDDRGVCPDGWHVPSDAEYTVLTDYLDGVSVKGGKMKSTGTIEGDDGLWYSPNGGATNESGFTGLPAGYRYYYNGLCSSMGSSGYFWSSSESNSYYAWSRHLSHYHSYVSRYSGYKRSGFSIRCLGD